MSNHSVERQVRRLQYRLKRQGMLELDVWLSQLRPAFETGDEKLFQCIEVLLSCEPPELLAMHTGEKPIPKELERWLNI